MTARLLVAMLALYGLLAAASVGVRFFTSPASTLRQQIDSWWLIFPVVSLAMLFYPLGPMALTLLIGLLALRELGHHHSQPIWRFQLACLAVMLLQTALSLHSPALATAVVAALLLVQAACFYLRRSSTPMLLLLLFLLLSLGLSFLPRLLQLTSSEQTNLAWFFYLMAMTALNDVAQFISGKSLGKHRIAAHISPNKTWQGLLGGVLASLAISVVLGSWLQLATVPELLKLALLLSPAGFVGDLLFSAAKRRLGIKDFSQLIPGHGGILDRVDSLVLTAPTLYLALTW